MINFTVMLAAVVAFVYILGTVFVIVMFLDENVGALFLCLTPLSH